MREHQKIVLTCPRDWGPRCLCSREFIRAMYGDPCMSVPSPTYLLQNIYDDIEGGPSTHARASMMPHSAATSAVAPQVAAVLASDFIYKGPAFRPLCRSPNTPF